MVLHVCADAIAPKPATLMWCLCCNSGSKPAAPKELRWWTQGNVISVSDSMVVIDNKLFSFDPARPAHLTPVASAAHLDVVEIHQAQHACALLTAQGHVYTWTDAQTEGSSFFKGPAFRNREPQRVLGALEGKVVTSISIGTFQGGTSVAAVTDEALYTWGCGATGVLCHGDVEDVDSPRLVEFFASLPVQFVCMDGGRMVVITAGGFLFVSGVSYWEMTALKSLYPSEWKAYSELLASDSSCILDESTNVVAEGLEESSLLGSEALTGEGERLSQTEHITQTSISSSFCSEAGRAVNKLAKRIGTPTRIEVGSGKRFVHAAISTDRVAAVTDCGQLYAWALLPRAAAMLGHDCKLVTEPHAVAALAKQKVLKVWMTAKSSAVLTEKGRLFTWGMRDALGHAGTKTHKFVPKKVEALCNVRVLDVFWNIRFSTIVSSSSPVLHEMDMKAIEYKKRRFETINQPQQIAQNEKKVEERNRKRAALASIENLGQC